VITPAYADLGPENVLVLVNADSATSQYIAKLYRQYYPEITDTQVLQLSGLADCSGPDSTAADEVMTRQVYNASVAEPVRQHLINNNLLDQIMVIVTTAGMPYRIEDTNPNYANVIYPGGSNWQLVAAGEKSIDAASVESDLTCLWVGDYGSNPAGLQNRIVNPYQACRSSISLFDRSTPDATGLRWTYAYSFQAGVASPTMEGNRFGYGTNNRLFGPGHIYLTCRLDGPKDRGQSAVFAVRKMLGRSKQVSDPAFGVSPQQAAVVLDDAPFDAATGMNNLDLGRVFNLNANTQYWEYTPGVNAPPDAYHVNDRDDYVSAYEQIAGLSFNFSKVLASAEFQDAQNLLACLDYRTSAYLGQTLLNETSAFYPGRAPDQSVIAYASFGRNGDDGKTKDYLYTGGDDGGPMFTLANGAIFTSLESFNAVTLFSDQATSQAKIIDFIDIGGSAAIGHSFEPQTDGAIDNEFVFYNFLADKDGDAVADLCFAEAAWTGIPYLSWTEVVIGDPLMRVHYGPGAPQAWEPVRGDVNCDGMVNIRDLVYLRNLNHCGGEPSLYDADPVKRKQYEDLCDLNKDGCNDMRDLVILKNLN
jgi:hypothetical protein